MTAYWEENLTYPDGTTMECQCEHVIHTRRDEDDFILAGCLNVATTRISESWAICDECEATMGVYDPTRPSYMECTDEGPYAGLCWHADWYHNIRD